MTAGTAPAGAPTERPLGIAGRIGVLLIAAASVAFGTSGDFGALPYMPYVVVGAVLAIRRPRKEISRRNKIYPIPDDLWIGELN